MRWPLSLLAGVALLVPLPGSAEAAGPLLRVLDGDTYEILIEGFPTRVRLANADTPETGPREKCAEELAWGNRATGFVREQVFEQGRSKDAEHDCQQADLPVGGSDHKATARASSSQTHSASPSAEGRLVRPKPATAF